MDPATLANGVTDALGDFSTAYGPVVLVVVGIALGLWGLKLAYSFITNMIRIRATR